MAAQKPKRRPQIRTKKAVMRTEKSTMRPEKKVSEDKRQKMLHEMLTLNHNKTFERVSEFRAISATPSLNKATKWTSPA